MSSSFGTMSSSDKSEDSTVTDSSFAESSSSGQSIPRSIHTPSIASRTHNAMSRAKRNLLKPFRHSPPASFRFNDLPKELRLKIWEAAIEPRVHELHPCAKLYDEKMTFRSNSSKTPDIFHICAESRQIALANYQLMQYQPPNTEASSKGILRFYFCPALDTLLLNSLMGLFMMFMLLESEEDYVGVGVMDGWQKIAFDAERAQLISLLSGIAGHAPRPRFQAVFPAMKELIIAFDYTRKGKTRFRTSVWPGENGTSLCRMYLPPPPGRRNALVPGEEGANEQEEAVDGDGEVLDGEEQRDRTTELENIFRPMKGYLTTEYTESGLEVPKMTIARVKRKRFVRGDVRYAFRKTCSFFGVRPRGMFRRL